MVTKIPLSLSITADGRLYLHEDVWDDQELISCSLANQIRAIFKQGYEKGLLRLGFMMFEEPLSASLCFWQHFAQCFVSEVYKKNHFLLFSSNFTLHFPEKIVNRLLVNVLNIQNIKHLHMGNAKRLWQALFIVLKEAIHSSDPVLLQYLSTSPLDEQKLVGSIHFHLIENTPTAHYPFSFQATCILKSSNGEYSRHRPLGEVLSQYIAPASQPAVISLLSPVKQASENSYFLKQLFESGHIYQTLNWRQKVVFQFLQDVSLFESAGITVHLPKNWSARVPPMPHVRFKIGENTPKLLGLDALLDFHCEIVLPNGESLSLQELDALIASREQLVRVKNQWVQLDFKQLKKAREEWILFKQIDARQLSWLSGLRCLAGLLPHKEIFPLKATDNTRVVAKQVSGEKSRRIGDEKRSLLAVNEYRKPQSNNEFETETLFRNSSTVCNREVIAGKWLKKILTQLRNPETDWTHTQKNILDKNLTIHLRPYQIQGIQWLLFLYQMRLGGCLADDMGLGKTIQLLGLLVLLKYQHGSTLNTASQISVPHLLIVPTSLLNNWQSEVKKISPSLNIKIIHRSVNNALSEKTPPTFSGIDLVITTYAMVKRLTWLTQLTWDILVLDEAQAIKNPRALQTRLIKSLKSQVKFVLTGTPIENNLTDLWSLFDFIMPGLLGSQADFQKYSQQSLQSEAPALKPSKITNLGFTQPHNPPRSSAQTSPPFHLAIRRLISPYFLRRLKCDETVIQDLSHKEEVQDWCSLTALQAELYQRVIKQLEAQLVTPLSRIRRQGLVLSYLIQLKQICNHPDQWLKKTDYKLEQSGKFLKLKEICHAIAEKKEKLLVFTQFREIIPILYQLLEKIFGQAGLYLHGQTTINARKKRVDAFQAPKGPPFFILSLKAGGLGLNLTAASQIIHFDRWWNPATEQQATDRVYRIGQTQDILVHKLICRGTIEEKISQLIYQKQHLTDTVVGQTESLVLSQLSDEALIKTITLDIHQVVHR
jgi:SNF2-related domain/SNF2 Helicase protein/Helicase conserved C-terminal domain